MVKLIIDGTEFTLRPENAETVREMCASIKSKGYKQKTRKITRGYPKTSTSTRDYVQQYGELNSFGRWYLDFFEPLNDRPTTHYDPTQPVCVQEC
jgi:hypothetical protein